MGYRTIDAVAARAALLAGRRAGLTLSAASAAAGVHIASACRWQSADPAFADALRDAARAAAAMAASQRAKAADPYCEARPRPAVDVYPDCPACGRRSEVRKTRQGFPFWQCSRWPTCPWASWRPRSPWACAGCGGVTVWSHTRLSIVCTSCGTREVGDANFDAFCGPYPKGAGSLEATWRCDGRTGDRSPLRAMPLGRADGRQPT